MTRLLIALLALAFAAPSQPDLGVPSSTGLVVSTSSIASDIGAQVLADGGNAVDAAVATAFALAVTDPRAGNIGGGGFMIVRTPDGKATTIDYREMAPGKATPTMYLDAEGRIDRSRTARGCLTMSGRRRAVDPGPAFHARRPGPLGTFITWLSTEVSCG